MMAGTVTITGSSTGEPAGLRTVTPLLIPGQVVIGETLAVSLASGDNTFNVPLGAVACLIVPPINGSVTLLLRSNLNSSDGGLPISDSLPSVYTFPNPAPTSLIIHASAPQTSFLNIWFW